MSTETRNMSGRPRPIAIGTGLVALDVVYSEDGEEPIGKWAGGTCGNVLVIRSFLGWSTYPVARLADNASASLLCGDLASWGVYLEYILQERKGSTPIIMHRIQQDGKGHGWHYFSFHCPRCGGRLPGYRPVPVSTVRQMISSMPTPALFFFDRISRGAIDMATAFRKQGALIFFEPSTQINHRLFQEALAVSHIVKVSRERWTERREFSPCETNWLLIETLGSEGLRFLSHLPSYRSCGWQYVPGFPLGNYRDTAGAGDWCTAGVLACLGTQGAKGLEQAEERKVREALQHGQLLASWNCGFEGARGGMYVTQRQRLEELALGITPYPCTLRLKPHLQGNCLREEPQDDSKNAEHLSELCCVT